MQPALNDEPCRTGPDPVPIRILSVSPAGDDHAALREATQSLACCIEAADTYDAAVRRLNRGDISIVVCESNLPDGTWRDLLDCVVSSPGGPLLIVTSSGADEQLWAEVLNMGGYDVIAKPFNRAETEHILRTACLGTS